MANIIQDNPNNPAPLNILQDQILIGVEHYGFDSKVHFGQIVVSKKVAEEVKIFFKKALDLQFPIKSVTPISDEKYKWNDEKSCADNNTAGFNYRTIAGTNRLSKHALGLAIDVNPVQNIYLKYDERENEIYRFPPDATYDTSALGTLTLDHPLVLLMKNFGWEWGGDWTESSGRIDYQHFEKRN